MKEKNKSIYIEVLRIISSFLVLYNHSSIVMTNISADDFSKSRVVALLLFYLSKTAVPVFLMIAGANLINKQDTGHRYIQRLGKTAGLILFFSVFYDIYYNHAFSVKTFISHLFCTTSSTALWYLYLYLGILILLPFIRKWNLEAKHYVILTALYCLGPGLFPVIAYYFGVAQPEKHLLMVIPAGYLILFLMGDYMENKLAEKYYCKQGAVCAVVCFIMMLFISLMLSVHQMNISGFINNNDIYGTIYYFQTVILSISVFYLAKYLFRDIHSKWFKTYIIKVGSTTLGIYVLGDFLRDYFEFVSDYLKARIGQFQSILLYDMVVFMAGFAVVCIYQFIKRIFHK